MSKLYDEYLEQHKANVRKAFSWIEQNLPEVLPQGETLKRLKENIKNHDASKTSKEEYDAYDKYFYGINRTYEVVQAFRLAWLKHIHNNPHHWQHWILINDDPEEGIMPMDIPEEYIIEMVCDWWSFSFSKGNLNEIFDWYREHRAGMTMSYVSLEQVDNIINLIKSKLIELENVQEGWIVKND